MLTCAGRWAGRPDAGGGPHSPDQVAGLGPAWGGTNGRWPVWDGPVSGRSVLERAGLGEGWSWRGPVLRKAGLGEGRSWRGQVRAGAGPPGPVAVAGSRGQLRGGGIARSRAAPSPRGRESLLPSLRVAAEARRGRAPLSRRRVDVTRCTSTGVNRAACQLRYSSTRLGPACRGRQVRCTSTALGPDGRRQRGRADRRGLAPAPSDPGDSAHL
jgi:hypothetical protein